MAFYEDAEQARDKLKVKGFKDQLDDLIQRGNDYIDKITGNRYGDLTRNMDRINLVKTRLTAMKTKYNSPAVDAEIDGYISTIDTQKETLKSKWDTEIYNILNA